MNAHERRACLLWGTATAVLAVGVVIAYLVDAGIAAGWTSIGIAVGIAVTRMWPRSKAGSNR